MNSTINKFLVAAVTVLGAMGALIADGVSVNDVIAMVILFANALGVYAIPNATRPGTGAYLHTSERGSVDIRHAILVLTVLAMVAMGFTDTEKETAPAHASQDESTVTTRVEGDVTIYTNEDHSFNGYHAGAYYWTGTKHSDIRYLWVFDRTTDPASSQGLREYIGAMQNLWGNFPGLPYLLYYDDRANAGGCFDDGVGGHVSQQVGLTSLILACNDNPRGEFGRAWWAIRNGHLYGEASVWLKSGIGAGYSYTGWCHEIGHVIQFAGHSTEPSSCMYTPLNLSLPSDRYKGYTQKDLDELLSNYYSHSLGGES